MSLKGDESSWSFNLEIGTSGGKQAHLSRHAAEEIKKALLKGAESLNEIYKIMGDAKESGANPKDIAAKIAPYWADVQKALTKLDKDVKKPSNQSELFLSFGVGGSEETGMAATAGLTFRF